jgi:hypothetical protein
MAAGGECTRWPAAVRVGVNCHPAAGLDLPQSPIGQVMHNLAALEMEGIIDIFLGLLARAPENFLVIILGLPKRFF